LKLGATSRISFSTVPELRFSMARRVLIIKCLRRLAWLLSCWVFKGQEQVGRRCDLFSSPSLSLEKRSNWQGCHIEVISIWFDVWFKGCRNLWLDWISI
jgi:hypothetical protein